MDLQIVRKLQPGEEVSYTDVGIVRKGMVLTVTDKGGVLVFNRKMGRQWCPYYRVYGKTGRFYSSTRELR